MDLNDKIVVCDKRNQRLQVFSEDGVFFETIELKGMEPTGKYVRNIFDYFRSCHQRKRQHDGGVRECRGLVYSKKFTLFPQLTESHP